MVKSHRGRAEDTVRRLAGTHVGDVHDLGPQCGDSNEFELGRRTRHCDGPAIQFVGAETNTFCMVISDVQSTHLARSKRDKRAILLKGPHSLIRWTGGVFSLFSQT